jgi:hypothetical protein
VAWDMACSYPPCENNVARPPTEEEPIYSKLMQLSERQWITFFFCSKECMRNYWPSRTEVYQRTLDARAAAKAAAAAGSQQEGSVVDEPT